MFLKILQKKQETEQIFSLIFEKPKGLHFYAGQYINIELTVNGKITSDRFFTISSSPTEDFLMVTARKGLTDFKKSMAALQTSDIISASHPIGTFTLDQSQPAVFMTGGIGITPFRSMVRYVLDQKISTKITLIYSNSDNNFLFKKELDKWQKQLPSLTIHYIITSQNGRLTKLPTTNYQLPIYYLAGPPKMVDDFESLLTGLKIDEVNIRYDRFDGYIEY